jgi:predicted RNA binding protein YcfA (HicA-like mRNA interferase family)
MGLSENSRKRIDVESRLRAEGWAIVRKGPGDHVQYKHPDKTGRVTIDVGERDIPRGTLRSIYRQAGWDW